MKLCPVGANLFRADREMTGKHEEANSCIFQFCKCA